MRDYDENILDVFRILATVQVFLGHMISHFYMPWFPTVVIYFIRGVPILFVLCGFLAAKSLECTPTKKWLVRRATRILPAFWACIIVNTIVIICIYDYLPTFREFVIYLVTQFAGLNFYTGDWLRSYGVGTPNGVLWTIAVQIQFFLLAPWIHKKIKNHSGTFNIILLLLMTAVSVICRHCENIVPTLMYKIIGVTVLPYLYFLVLGMVIWYFRDYIIPMVEKYRWFLLAGYILWKFLENNFLWPHLFDGQLYNVITTILLGLIVFAFSFRTKWRMKRDLTYGFYLYHMVIINVLVELGYQASGGLFGELALIFAIAVCTLLCAYLSQRLIEKPIVSCVERKISNG